MQPADHLRQIAVGFQHAKILLAASQLRVFDRLSAPGTDAASLAAALGADPRALEVLLDALVAIEIVEKHGGRYTTRPDYDVLLREDAPTHTVAQMRHMNRLFRRWAYLEDRVLGRAMPDTSAPEQQPRDHEDFIRAMYAGTHRQAAAITGRIPLDGVRRIADLGGGPGHYLAAFLDRDARLEGVLVDVPATLDVARRVQAGHPNWARMRPVAWDMYGTEPPPDLVGIDLAFVSQVVHSEGPRANAAFFARVARVLAPGGRVVVHERVSDPDRTSPAETAVFAVNMLAMTAEGQTYTDEEISGWAAAAGLRRLSGERVSERSYLLTFGAPPHA